MDYLTVLRGNPTPAELAALVVALRVRESQASRTGRPSRAGRAPRTGEPPCTGPSCAWADPAALLRQPVRPGPDAWRRSALPH